MAKLIIDATTGTILNIEDCYIVDSEALGDDDNLSDTELAEIANKFGISIQDMARETGFGDNKYRYTVSYSPLSLKDEAYALLEGGVYDNEGDEEYQKALAWASEVATISELEELSERIMAYDSIWDGFRENFIDELVSFHRSKQDLEQ